VLFRSMGGANALGIQLAQGDVLRYFFTYSVGAAQSIIDCDSPSYTFNAPAPAQAIEGSGLCPVVQYSYTLTLLSGQQQPTTTAASLFALKYQADLSTLTVPGNIAWVDAHISINGAPTLNYRMDSVSNTLFQTLGTNDAGISLRSGDQLSFFFSYCVGASACCDGEMFALTV